MKKRTFWVVILIAALTLLTVSVAQATVQDKVDICHATASESNPFTNPEVNKSSIIEGPNGHDTHSGDIIPVFTYMVNEQTGTTSECHDELVQVGTEDFCPSSYPYMFAGKCWKSLWQSIPVLQRPVMELQQVCVNVPVFGDVAYTYPGKNLTTMYNGATGAQVLANGCEIPYVPCSETLPEQVISDSDWYDVGDPYGFGPWIQVGPTQYESYGSQDEARDIAYAIYDARDGTTVCSSRQENPKNTYEVTKQEDGSLKLKTSNDCGKAQAWVQYFDPDGVKINGPKSTYRWILPLALETAELQVEGWNETVIITEKDKCLGSDGMFDDINCESATLCYRAFDYKGNLIAEECDDAAWSTRENESVVLVIGETEYSITKPSECVECRVSGYSLVTLPGNYPGYWIVPNSEFIEQGYYKNLPPRVEWALDNDRFDLVNRGCLPDVEFEGNGKFSMEKLTTCDQPPVCFDCDGNEVQYEYPGFRKP